MRAGVLLAAAALGGCAGDDRAGAEEPAACPAPEAAPSPLVRPGDHRLEVTYVGGEVGRGARIAIEPDGRFTGRGWQDLWMCEGIVQPVEADAIADAINEAEVLRRGSNPQPCADHAEYHITITGVAGEIDGLTHTLRYEVCDNVCPAFDAFIEAALAPAERATAEGPCVGCPPDLQPGECYGEAGSELVCDDGVARACEDTGGEVVDCERSASLQCEPGSGWVPAATWSVADATLRRSSTDGDPRISLELALTVDNQGASPIDLTHAFALVVVLDDDGEPIDPLTVGGVGGINVVAAAGNTLATYGLTFFSGTAEGSPILDVSAPSIRIPERPWEGSPSQPAVPIAVVDEP